MGKEQGFISKPSSNVNEIYYFLGNIGPSFQIIFLDINQIFDQCIFSVKTQTDDRDLKINELVAAYI